MRPRLSIKADDMGGGGGGGGGPDPGGSGGGGGPPDDWVITGGCTTTELIGLDSSVLIFSSEIWDFNVSFGDGLNKNETY